MFQRSRGLVGVLNGDGRYKFKAPEFVIDHLIIGGGVVGLAVAEALVRRFPQKTTYVVERHPRVGEETRRTHFLLLHEQQVVTELISSSRNSEVIHAGLYYPSTSSKTKLCLLGRNLLYNYCDQHRVPYKKTGKLVVANSNQLSYIQGLHDKARKLEWPTSLFGRPMPPPLPDILPTSLLTATEVHDMEPNLSEDIVAALWSPETGIIDSHTLMETLESQIADSEGGEVVCSTRVVRVDPSTSSTSLDSDGWVVQMVTGDSTEGDAVLAKTIICSAGLSGPFVLNSILPPEKRIPMYFARGSYASYHGTGISNISHLIYPCPETGPNAHAFESLGTHLTLDLQGKVKFGPDIEWLSPMAELESQTGSEEPAVVSEERAGFWKDHLVPNETRLAQMHDAVTRYLPDVALDGLQPDYVGIRPKLIPPGGGFQDFVIRTDYPTAGVKSRNPMISLLGIESPGLTSSLAIGQLVAGMIEMYSGVAE